MHTRSIVFVVACLFIAVPGAQEKASPESSKRLDTLRYGIETQVIELLDTLKSEKNTDYAKEILSVFDASSSPKLRTAIFQYLGSMQLDDAESRGLDIISDRDNQIEALVQAAFSYLHTIESRIALKEALAILDEGDKRYLTSAIKAIGGSGGENEASALVKAYEADDVTQATKEAIVLALGAMKASSAFELLSGIVSSDESGKAIRMFACTALGELGDEKAVAILVRATNSTDPNVRAAALAALGKYSTAEARMAMRESLRDTHVLPRIAAAKAVGEQADVEAIPYLEYKASYDPEKAVREASIKALSDIGGDRVDAFLSGFFSEAKNSLAYRAAALSAVVSKSGQGARSKALEAFAAAQEEKDRTVFTAFARALVALDDKNAVPFIALMLGDKEISIRLGALAWAERNTSKALEDTIKVLSENDSNDAVRKRADKALERLGS
ncbi:MAG: HEAT repeat domain-containing protein [Spirochaetia bacterium]|jgi:HEAT repeat protein|nr:HEAT repeat domain-containing protein [Spirochaetia bacterium]